MRPKSIILLVLALGCGLAASIGISQVMDANSGRAQVESTPIYVAVHNINLGDPLNASMVSLEEWPAEKVPQGAILTIEELEGRRPRTTIIAGTPVLEAQLLAQGELSDPVANIPSGFRLSTISVNAEKSAAGLLSPGDRVDMQLFVAANPRNGIPQAMTKLILQNIRVFAVEQVVQRSAEGDETKVIPKTVSLLVTPEQASKIDLAQNLGELSLIPRNPNDEGAASVAEITTADLLGSGSQRNQRDKEQGRSEPVQAKPSLFGTMLGMMNKAAKERPPFRMEIVQAEEVTEMLFDQSTNAPINGGDGEVSEGNYGYGGYGGYGESVRATPASFAKKPKIDFTPKEGSEDDFPIDLEEE